MSESYTTVKIFRDLNSIRQIPQPVLTIGTFDGVHKGHQKIIDQLNYEAKKINGESVLLTFYPHPRMVLYPETHGLQLIQTQEEKLQKLERMGLQNTIIFPFTFEFSRLTAIEFIRDIIVNQLHAKKLVIGYDHQFGRNREGSILFLKEIAETYALDIIEIPAQVIEDSNVSSTKIRDALKKGNIDLANSFLGEYYCLQGIVVHGNALGKTIGYPTANLLVDETTKLIPANGVYAVQVKRDGIWYNGMMNIGFRPTVSHLNIQTIEIHIFDFSEDLYGVPLVVRFITKIRDEVKFDEVDHLKIQLKQDEETIRAFFASR